MRHWLRKRGIRAVIPVPADQQGPRLRRGSRGGRPPVFSRETYKQRSTSNGASTAWGSGGASPLPQAQTAAIYLAGLRIAGVFHWSAR